MSLSIFLFVPLVDRLAGYSVIAGAKLPNYLLALWPSETLTCLYNGVNNSIYLSYEEKMS